MRVRRRCSRSSLGRQQPPLALSISQPTLLYEILQLPTCPTKVGLVGQASPVAADRKGSKCGRTTGLHTTELVAHHRFCRRVEFREDCTSQILCPESLRQPRLTSPPTTSALEGSSSGFKLNHGITDRADAVEDCDLTLFSLRSWLHVLSLSRYSTCVRLR
jgi:hypothetical protein